MGLRRSGANSQQGSGVRGEERQGGGGEEERLPRQRLTALLLFHSQMKRNPRCFCTVYSGKPKSALYIERANEQKLVQNKSEPRVHTFSWAPLHTQRRQANYRWTSHVHGHKDISEPVSSLQLFIKHWQSSAIIITGSEKTWLNRIWNEIPGKK